MIRHKFNPIGSTELNAHRKTTFVCLIVCLLMVLGLGQLAVSNTQQPQQPVAGNKAPENKEEEKDVRVLAVGDPIEREIAGGQSHSYQISLVEGQYLKVIVRQRGVDVSAQVMGPDRKPSFEYDNEIRYQGEEEIVFVAGSSGSHRVSVTAKPGEQSGGKYEIKVVEMRAATGQEVSLQEARRFFTESLAFRRAGKSGEAFQSAERGLEIREKILGPDHIDVAESLNNLAFIESARGDNEKAEALLLRALSIREKALGPDHQAIATTLSDLASVYFVKGDYNKAEPLNQRSLAIIEKNLGPEHPLVASLLNNLASVYFYKVEYAKAEPLHQRALAIREKALGPDHPDVAVTLDNLGLLYTEMGAYAQAEPLHRRALAIREKVLGPDHPRVANSLNTLAILYSEKGDYANADQLFHRALAIREKALGPENRFVAESLNNLGNFYQDSGDYGKAEPYHQRALAIWEKALGPDHPYVATSRSNLGNLYYGKGDYLKAESFYQRALAIREKTLGPDHRDVAVALNNLANVFCAKGDYGKAEPLYQRALIIHEKTLGPDHRDVSSLLNNMARLYASMGDQVQAVAIQSRTNAINERNINLNLVIGSERQKSAYLALFSGQTDQTLSLHINSAPGNLSALRMAFTTLLQRKGRSLDAMSDTIAQLRRRAAAQDQALFDQLNDSISQIANLTFKGPDSKNPAAYLEQLKRLDEEKEKIEAELSQRSAEFRQQIKPLTLESVQATLPQDGALVEIASYSSLDMKTNKSGDSHYAVYVLFPHGEPRWVDLGKAEPIDQAIAAFREALHSSKNVRVKTLARDLDEKVMRPVRTLLGQTRSVLLSPDGALNLVPFAALVDEQNHYLVEQYSFTYLTSGRDLLRSRSVARIAKAPMIIADPDFGERASNRKTASSTGILDLRNAYFSPLSGTADEAIALKKILPQATVLTGARATEAALKHAASPSVLHIATHGFFLTDKVEDIAETDRRRKLLQLTGDPASLGARFENPLLRSGLGLAGANLRKNGDDDGILTAMEVAGLNLWGTKLVTLSACETGVGEVRTGEGVYGLRRALALAGAETQVMSLWPVSDRGTRELMIGYYKALQAGQGRSEAMRQVQLRMLKEPRRRHPFYWASFIVSGEWANLDGKR